MKQRKSVFFEDDELHLLEFSESKGNFSEYVKSLIENDMTKPRILPTFLPTFCRRNFKYHKNSKSTQSYKVLLYQGLTIYIPIR